MLNKTEKVVMHAIFTQCGQNGCCLLTADELESLLFSHKIKKEKIIAALKSLELDDYLDVLPCERHGEEVYCINLHSKGNSFERDRQIDKRAIVNKIILASLSAVVTFIVGRLLIYIFS